MTLSAEPVPVTGLVHPVDKSATVEQESASKKSVGTDTRNRHREVHQWGSGLGERFIASSWF